MRAATALGALALAAACTPLSGGFGGGYREDPLPPRPAAHGPARGALPLAAPGTRTVAVLAYVDEGYRAAVGWRRRIEEAIAAAARAFGPAGLAFSLRDVRTWHPPATSDVDAVLDALAAMPRDGAEIAVAFLGEPQLVRTSVDYAGRARYLGDVAVVRRETTARTGAILTHELGHLFGAIHSPDPRSIMFESLREGPLRVDEVTALLVAAHRARAFDRSRPPLTGEQADGAVAALEEAVRRDPQGGEAREWLELARRLRERVRAWERDRPGRASP